MARFNLVPNPGFEADLSGWSAQSGFGVGAFTTFARSSVWSDSGGWSARVTPNVMNPGQLSQITTNSPRIRINPGATYSARMTINVLACPAGCSMGMALDSYDASGTYINNAIANGFTTTGIGVSAYDGYTVPSNAVYMEIVFAMFNNTGAAGVQLDAYVDSVLMDQVATHPSYADGNSPNWMWDGLPNVSSSSERGARAFTTSSLNGVAFGSPGVA